MKSGTIVTPDGIRPDPVKVEAIIGMPTPTDKAGVRRLLGMINFLAAHVPDMSVPICDLLKADVIFQWGPEQAKSMERIKKILSTVPVLSYFDPDAQSMIYTSKCKPVWLGCLSFPKRETSSICIKKPLTSCTLKSKKRYWL